MGSRCIRRRGAWACGGGGIWPWSRNSSFSRVVEADNEFALSPIRRTVTEGTVGRFSPDGDDWQRYPLLRRLGGLGVTDYVAFPIGQFNGRFIAMTFCALAPAGFTSQQIAVSSKIAPAFGAVVEAHLLKRVSVDLLDTYLGRAGAYGGKGQRRQIQQSAPPVSTNIRL
jgi:hypothetical protein